MSNTNIKVIEHKYLGFKQGYKVIIDGMKFPREHGHWYTTMDANEARDNAIHDARLFAFKNTFSPNGK